MESYETTVATDAVHPFPRVAALAVTVELLPPSGCVDTEVTNAINELVAHPESDLPE